MYSPTSIPIVVPVINPDDSSVEYMLTMKEAATLAYLWNVGLFPSESARPTVFELLFKNLRLEEASMHTLCSMHDSVSMPQILKKWPVKRHISVTAVVYECGCSNM